MTPALSLRQIFNAGVDLLFPPRCAGCGRVDTSWCAACQQALDTLPLQIQYATLPLFTHSAATGIHEGKLQQAVHALKYADALMLATPLSERMIACLQALHWQFDLIAPVPLHTVRLRQRRYNQAELLAEALAEAFGIRCAPRALERLRDTPPQVGLNRQQRWANVHQAFAADPAQVTGAAILLIDDVFTTGATLQACARAALDAGARTVMSLTVTAAR